jgi:hypothetical protein
MQFYRGRTNRIQYTQTHQMWPAFPIPLISFTLALIALLLQLAAFSESQNIIYKLIYFSG